jgi:hypothetical protein
MPKALLTDASVCTNGLRALHIKRLCSNLRKTVQGTLRYKIQKVCKIANPYYVSMFFMVESLTQNTGHLSSLILAKKQMLIRY